MIEPGSSVVTEEHRPGAGRRHVASLRTDRAPEGGTGLRWRVTSNPTPAAVRPAVGTAPGGDGKGRLDRDLGRLDDRLETERPHDVAAEGHRARGSGRNPRGVPA